MTFSNNFSPGSKIISAISNANPGIVTTSTNHGYLDGLYVRLNIPIADGMQQVNGNVYLITILTPTTFSIGVDTSKFDVFSLSSAVQSAQVIPVGEVATTLKNLEKNQGNIIPES